MRRERGGAVALSLPPRAVLAGVAAISEITILARPTRQRQGAEPSSTSSSPADEAAPVSLPAIGGVLLGRFAVHLEHGAALVSCAASSTARRRVVVGRGARRRRRSPDDARRRVSSLAACSRSASTATAAAPTSSGSSRCLTVIVNSDGEAIWPAVRVIRISSTCSSVAVAHAAERVHGASSSAPGRSWAQMAAPV
jgi:hypothetical protein